MTLEEKINIVKNFKDLAIASLNSYLDKIYSLTQDYLTEDNKLKSNLPEDEKVYNFICELKEDAKKYENIRRKILKNDFNLSLQEINYVGLAFFYSIQTMTREKEILEKTIKELDSIYKDLISKDIDLLKKI